MNVKLIIDGKEHAVGYRSYKEIISNLADDDNTYVELVDQLVREGSEEMWMDAASRDYLKDETVLFLIEHGSASIFERLLYNDPIKRVLTPEILKEKWDKLPVDALSALCRSHGEFLLIPSATITNMLMATNRIDVYYALAGYHNTPRSILLTLSRNPDIDLAAAAKRRLKNG